jgi:hypothetical protein
MSDNERLAIAETMIRALIREHLGLRFDDEVELRYDADRHSALVVLSGKKILSAVPRGHDGRPYSDALVARSFELAPMLDVA